jgi:hypothetical protein
LNAAQHAQSEASAFNLQQLLVQSRQPALLSWLRRWLPQQLQTGATPAVLDTAMQPAADSSAAACSCSSSSSEMWQQANDLARSGVHCAQRSQPLPSGGRCWACK